MGFELQTHPAPEALAVLGQVVELRELPYGQMRDAMAAAEKPKESADRLLAACLHVDGVPLGYEALQALPGRLSGAIARALEDALRIHGLGSDKGGDAPKA